jgi:hypothetical protein
MAGAHVFQAIQHSELDTLGLVAIRDFLKKRERYLRFVAQNNNKADGVNFTPISVVGSIDPELSISRTVVRRTSRMQRGPEGVVIFIADMSISVALHFCLSLSPLIAMFSMICSSNTPSLRGYPRFIASVKALRGIAE